MPELRSKAIYSATSLADAASVRGFQGILEDYDRRWLLAVAAVAAVLLIRPVGFAGGGSDDWQYLNAARCWVANGPCIPANHWQARWPIVAPLAAVIALLGESRTTVGIPSLLASLVCLLLIARLGNALFGRPVGLAAALILAMVPPFALQLLDPMIDGFELAFILAGCAAIERMAQRPGYRWAAIAGLMFGLAVQSRETALFPAALALLAGIIKLPKSRRRELLVAGAAFLLPLLAEFAVYYLATGDPLWRRKLSMAHTRIFSTELNGPVDTSRSPLLNPNYIANWKHEPGLRVHWSVDGLINLFINANTGFLFTLAPALLLVSGSRLPARDRTIGGWLIAAAIAHACWLTYVLAMDPKARVMQLPLALLAVVFAMLCVRLWTTPSRPIALLALAAMVIASAVTIQIFPRSRDSEPVAQAWAQAYPGEIETILPVKASYPFAPAIQQFPLAGSGRKMLLIRLASSCRRWPELVGLKPGQLTPVRSHVINPLNQLIYGRHYDLCLFRYDDPAARAPVRQALLDFTAPPAVAVGD